jgi:hypothetical protein
MKKEDLQRVIEIIEQQAQKESDPLVRSLLVKIVNLLLAEFG